MTHWKEAEDPGVSLPSVQVHNTLKAQLFTNHMSPVGHREACKPFKNLYYVSFKTKELNVHASILLLQPLVTQSPDFLITYPCH